MTKRIISEVRSRREIIAKLLELSEEKVKSFPDGRIKVKHRKSGIYYYLTNEGNEDVFIPCENNHLIEDLIQKNYLEKVIKVSEQEIAVLKRFESQYPEVLAEDIYESLSDDRKIHVKPIVLTDEQFVEKWQNRPYTPKPFKQGDSYFETLRGERVRSKSEVIIADRLFTSGIPYKYECPLVVGKNTIYPDFTLLRVSDRKILYLEHNGKVGDQVYGDDMVDRLNKYTLAGIYQGDRLFMTFESANRPLDVRVVDKMINDLFK